MNALSDVTVVAAKGRPSPQTPFAVRPLIGRSSDGKLFELTRWQEGRVDGAPYSQADLDIGVDAGDFLSLAERSVCAHLEAWLFGDPVLAEDALRHLRQSGCFHDVIEAEGGAIVLVDAKQAAPVRDTLHQNYITKSLNALTTRDDQLALQMADVAWLLARTRTAVDFGVLIAAHRQVGNDARAEFFVRMARSTHGPVFASESVKFAEGRSKPKEPAGNPVRRRYLAVLREQQESLSCAA